MNKQLSYYATGKSTFRPGETIYINRATEETKSHLHAHEFIEIAYVSSGTGIHQIDTKEYAVSKGDLFVINYDVPHQFRSLSREKDPLIIYNCVFQPEFLDYTLINCKDFYDITQHFLFRSLFPNEDPEQDNIKLLKNDYKIFEVLYKKMYDEYIKKNSGYIEMLRAYVIELLVTIFRLYKKEDHPAADPIKLQRQKIIHDVLIYMKNNYYKDIKLEELSMMSFFSRNYFCKVFKDLTGMTVSEYIQKIRIQEACHLLRTTNNTVLEIGNQVGYKDIKFFAEIFKRYTGKTPGSYRKDIS